MDKESTLVKHLQTDIIPFKEAKASTIALYLTLNETRINQVLKKMFEDGASFSTNQKPYTLQAIAERVANKKDVAPGILLGLKGILENSYFNDFITNNKKGEPNKIAGQQLLDLANAKAFEMETVFDIKKKMVFLLKTPESRNEINHVNVGYYVLNKEGEDGEATVEPTNTSSVVKKVASDLAHQLNTLHDNLAEMSESENKTVQNISKKLAAFLANLHNDVDTRAVIEYAQKKNKQNNSQVNQENSAKNSTSTKTESGKNIFKI